MTTFQAIVYGMIHGFTEFLPVSAAAHESLVPYLLGWDAPSGALYGALSLGAFLALLIYFRHDWASIISCFLQVIIYRKRPMTLDERLPFFIAITSAPVALAWHYLQDKIESFAWSPSLIALTLAGFAVPMYFTESLSRKSKKMFDWNWLDSLWVGLSQLLMFIPGCDRLSGILLGAFSRNYSRESALKYGFFAAAPVLAANTIHHLGGVDWSGSSPRPDLSWLSFGVALIVTLLCGLLAMGGLMKHIQRKGLGHYVAYRLFAGLGVAAFIWFKSRS